MTLSGDHKTSNKIPVWRSVGEGYSFLFKNPPCFAIYAVPLTALLIGFDYLVWRTETGVEIYFFLFGWMWKAKLWLLSEHFVQEYESYRFTLEALSWSPLFGKPLTAGWTPYILAEAAFAIFWIRAFLHGNQDKPVRTKSFAVAAGKIFVVIWIFENLRLHAGFAEYWMLMKGVEYAASHDSIFLLMVSIFVALPVIVLLLCRIPLAVPAIVAGAGRFGIDAIAAPGLFGNIRLLAALMLATLPLVAVNWLLVAITGVSYDSPRYTDHAVFATLIQFGQQLAVFASFAVSYGIYATAWRVMADASLSTGLSTPFQREHGQGGEAEPPTPPNSPPPGRA